jgi:hypothetical protein
LDVWEHGRVSYKEAIGSAVLDIRSEYPPNAEVYCFALRRVYHPEWGIFKRIKHEERHGWNYYVQGGLLLIKDANSEAQQNRFRRIGVFHIDPDYEHSFIDAVHQRMINLV